MLIVVSTKTVQFVVTDIAMENNSVIYVGYNINKPEHIRTPLQELIDIRPATPLDVDNMITHNGLKSFEDCEKQLLGKTEFTIQH